MLRFRRFWLVSLVLSFVGAHAINLDAAAAGGPFFGVVPDYTVEVSGMRLASVVAGGPADKAGVLAGDVVVELAGNEVRSIRDFVQVTQTLQVGKKVTIVVKRNEETFFLNIVPVRRG